MAPKLPIMRRGSGGNGTTATSADSAQDTISVWQKQGYPLPDEAAEGSREDVKGLYRFVCVPLARV